MKDFGITFYMIIFAVLQIYLQSSQGLKAKLKSVMGAAGSPQLSNLINLLILPIYAIMEISKLSSTANLGEYWTLLFTGLLSLSLRIVVCVILVFILNLNKRSHYAYALVLSFPALGPYTLSLGNSLCFKGSPLYGDPLCDDILGLMMLLFLIFSLLMFSIGMMVMNKHKNEVVVINEKLKYLLYVFIEKENLKDPVVEYLFEKYIDDEDMRKTILEDFIHNHQLIVDNNFNYLYLNKDEIDVNAELNNRKNKNDVDNELVSNSVFNNNINAQKHIEDRYTNNLIDNKDIKNLENHELKDALNSNKASHHVIFKENLLKDKKELKNNNNDNRNDSNERKNSSNYNNTWNNNNINNRQNSVIGKIKSDIGFRSNRIIKLLTNFNNNGNGIKINSNSIINYTGNENSSSNNSRSSQYSNYINNDKNENNKNKNKIDSIDDVNNNPCNYEYDYNNDNYFSNNPYGSDLQLLNNNKNILNTLNKQNSKNSKIKTYKLKNSTKNIIKDNTMGNNNTTCENNNTNNTNLNRKKKKQNSYKLFINAEQEQTNNNVKNDNNNNNIDNDNNNNHNNNINEQELNLSASKYIYPFSSNSPNAKLKFNKNNYLGLEVIKEVNMSGNLNKETASETEKPYDINSNYKRIGLISSKDSKETINKLGSVNSKQPTTSIHLFNIDDELNDNEEIHIEDSNLIIDKLNDSNILNISSKTKRRKLKRYKHYKNSNASYNSNNIYKDLRLSSSLYNSNNNMVIKPHSRSCSNRLEIGGSNSMNKHSTEFNSSNNSSSRKKSNKMKLGNSFLRKAIKHFDSSDLTNVYNEDNIKRINDVNTNYDLPEYTNIRNNNHLRINSNIIHKKKHKKSVYSMFRRSNKKFSTRVDSSPIINSNNNNNLLSSINNANVSNYINCTNNTNNTNISNYSKNKQNDNNTSNSNSHMVLSYVTPNSNNSKNSNNSNTKLVGDIQSQAFKQAQSAKILKSEYKITINQDKGIIEKKLEDKFKRLDKDISKFDVSSEEENDFNNYKHSSINNNNIIKEIKYSNDDTIELSVKELKGLYTNINFNDIKNNNNKDTDTILTVNNNIDNNNDNDFSSVENQQNIADKEDKSTNNLNISIISIPTPQKCHSSVNLINKLQYSKTFLKQFNKRNTLNKEMTKKNNKRSKSQFIDILKHISKTKTNMEVKKSLNLSLPELETKQVPVYDKLKKLFYFGSNETDFDHYKDKNEMNKIHNSAMLIIEENQNNLISSKYNEYYSTKNLNINYNPDKDELSATEFKCSNSNSNVKDSYNNECYGNVSSQLNNSNSSRNSNIKYIKNSHYTDSNSNDTYINNVNLYKRLNSRNNKLSGISKNSLISKNSQLPLKKESNNNVKIETDNLLFDHKNKQSSKTVLSCFIPKNLLFKKAKQSTNTNNTSNLVNNNNISVNNTNNSNNSTIENRLFSLKRSYINNMEDKVDDIITGNIKRQLKMQKKRIKKDKQTKDGVKHSKSFSPRKSAAFYDKRFTYRLNSNSSNNNNNNNGVSSIQSIYNNMFNTRKTVNNSNEGNYNFSNYINYINNNNNINNYSLNFYDNNRNTINYACNSNRNCNYKINDNNALHTNSLISPLSIRKKEPSNPQFNNNLGHNNNFTNTNNIILPDHYVTTKNIIKNNMYKLNFSSKLNPFHFNSMFNYMQNNNNNNNINNFQNLTNTLIPNDNNYLTNELLLELTTHDKSKTNIINYYNELFKVLEKYLNAKYNKNSNTQSSSSVSNNNSNVNFNNDLNPLAIFKMHPLLHEFNIEKLHLLAKITDKETPEFKAVESIFISDRELHILDTLWYNFKKYINKNNLSITTTILKPLDLKSMIKMILCPPIIGCMLGLMIGVSDLRIILHDTVNHYIGNIHDIINIVEIAFVPLLFANIGYMLASIKPINKNLSITKIQIIFSFIISFFIFPLMGLLYVYLLSCFSRDDDVINTSLTYKFSVFIPWAVPISPLCLLLSTNNDGFYINEFNFLISWQILLSLFFQSFALLIFFIAFGD